MHIRVREFLDGYAAAFGEGMRTQAHGLREFLSFLERDQWLEGEDMIPCAAYVLATVKHETAHSFLPREEFGQGHRYPYSKPVKIYKHETRRYFGRGYVQLTWLRNYARMTAWIGVNLVEFPDMALRPEVAYMVLVAGMKMGAFSGDGAGLEFYCKKPEPDYVNARKTVNGLDCAESIAEDARLFADLLWETARLDSASQLTASVRGKPGPAEFPEAGAPVQGPDIPASGVGVPLDNPDIEAHAAKL